MVIINALIDTIFNPVLGWLAQMSKYLNDLSVPASRPLRLSDYLGVFAYLYGWTTVITTLCALVFVYFVCYIIMTYSSLFIRFKDTVKWW